MKVYFAQIYVEVGVEFPFSCIFHHYLSDNITALVAPSAKFSKKYGDDFNLIFRMSAKTALQDNEICGPTVFRKVRDVEYTVFLPFDVIAREADVPWAALRFLLRGACSVFESLGIDTAKIIDQQESIIDHICSDPTMFETVTDD